MKPFYDVIVAGCGSAGFCAAVQAGRLGLKTLLIERSGMPGGILTIGGNNKISQFMTPDRRVIGGIGWEYVTRLDKMGGAKIPDFSKKYNVFRGVMVNIPLGTALMDEMLLRAGVDICYEQTVCAAETEETSNGRRIKAILVTSKSGLVRTSAKTYIDCTGDGDLSVFAGADYELGDEHASGLSLQPGTVRFFIHGEPVTPEKNAEIRAILDAEIAAGRLDKGDVMKYSYNKMLDREGNNVNHLSRFNGADSEDKTRMDIEGRRCVARTIMALRAAGIDPEVCTVATESAVRETRRIVCDHRITEDEYVSGYAYPDGVCHSYYPIDLHRDSTEKIQRREIEAGKVPIIPLSAMMVKGIENLYVAGRCAYGDRLANSAYRVKATCMAMGQACAAAAYVAVREHDGSIRPVDIAKIRDVLTQHGAILP